MYNKFEDYQSMHINETKDDGLLCVLTMIKDTSANGNPCTLVTVEMRGLFDTLDFDIQHLGYIV